MRAGVFVLGIVCLAGCDESVGAAVAPDTAPVVAPIARSATAGPGSAYAKAEFAAQVLSDACIATRPSFDEGPAALAKLGGFVQNSKTGTYFHGSQNVSVKIIPGRCSMVMTAQPGTLQSVVRTVRATNSDARVGDIRAIGGTAYLSFFVTGS